MSRSLVIREHRFTPELIEIPAGTKVALVIRNEDTASEEFESTRLHREKVIAGGGSTTVYVGPLPAGSYDFIGEHNATTAKGQIVVR